MALPSQSRWVPSPRGTEGDTDAAGLLGLGDRGERAEFLVANADVVNLIAEVVDRIHGRAEGATGEPYVAEPKMRVMTAQLNLPTVRHTFFQNSLMSALLDGIYDGEMSIGEILGHGNFGIGTFDGLDGEMIILDGVCWQVRGDGSACKASMSQRSPYTVVTNFVPHIAIDAPPNLTRSEISPIIDSKVPSQNFMYALRITGDFEWVKTRTVIKQQKPYQKMINATEEDASVDFEDVTGTIAGFRTPVYEKGISVPGCHVHFLADGGTGGGHVLDFKLRSGTIEICPGTDLQLRLPLTAEFSDADLAPDDLDDQIHATEVKG